ncbi:phage tail assembly chaperone [Frigidibacter oleivorans]|uniref:phage tail assembly chaperone n=1 Tax=Frigidibacter oleivorans TaxID=2487129 RepID=UPI001F241309|nr:hypothetical protein [Frigidibacter oleivorans]
MMDRLTDQLCAALTAHLRGGGAKPPEAGRQIWQAFGELSRARTYHAAGPNPITYSDIRAWCDLMRLPLEPPHVRAITAMDAAWLTDFHQTRQSAEGVKRLPQQSRQALTPAIFDMMTT